MKKFARIKTYDEIKHQCKEQGVPLNDHMYHRHGWDTVVVGHVYGQSLRDSYAIYNTTNGRFHGVTDGGIKFDSSSTKHEKAPWFQALLAFFYVEKK